MTPSAHRTPLIPLDDALATLLAYAVPLAATEWVSTFDADGRVLAQDAVSPLQVPSFDNSAMDGYAMCCADVVAAANQALPVSQRIAAGATPEPLQPGTVARIFTGAPLPLGADAVVMQEECAVQPDGTVRVLRPPRSGQCVRRAGEDVAKNAVVLSKGERLTPASIALAASIGMDAVCVSRRPRVALFSTGDELVMPGDVAPQDMRPGAIYNSNRFFLRALLQRMGCAVTDLGIVPDQRDATVAALRAASQSHDLILTSGGVSVGEEDHVKAAVQTLGSLQLWQLAIKPGKPFAYGSLDRSGTVGASHFIGLPGNPVASFVTFLLLVRPFVLRLQGATAVEPPSMQLPAHFNWPRADKRREFLRVRRNPAGGLDLFTNQSSGVLTSAAWADGLVDTQPGQTIAWGDTVRFIALTELQA